MSKPRSTPSDESDAALARACAIGASGAWDALVMRYSNLVWSVIGRSGIARERGEDIFQDVFAEAFAALPRMKAPERIDAWLVTTARRMVWKEWRRAKRDSATLPEDLRGIDDPGAPTPDSLEVRLLVRRGLGALSPRCRQLLIAAFADPGPPDYDRLAETMGMPRGSLGPTRMRCLESLAAQLKALGLGGEIP